MDHDQLHQDRQQLLNLQAFVTVTVLVRDSLSGSWITFVCQEVMRRLPIINFGGIRQNFWFQLGISDDNFLGRNGVLAATYRYYDRHSFEAFVDAPLLRFPDWGFRANLARLSTLEPAYFSEGESEYNVRHIIGIVGARYQLSHRNDVSADVGYLDERYRRSPASPQIGPQQVDLGKTLLRIGLSRTAIDYLGLKQDGYAITTSLESVKTLGEPQLFWKLLNVVRVYQPLPSPGTLAARLRIGLSRNEDSPFVPFVLDSYVTVRGVGNRVARGTAEVTANIEYRHILKQNHMWGMQGVMFVDVSGWRPPGETLGDIIAARNLVTFTGLGLRLHWFRLNHLVLRADYGISIHDRRWRGFVLGAGHYF